MSITVKHKFVSSIPDSTDTSLVRPTNWNDTHDLTGFGTMAEQNANAVAITGGSINGTTIGATTASTGAFTYISTSSSTNTTPTLSFNASNSPVAMGATVSGSYLQTVLQNKSGTAGASTNYVLSNDLGTDSTYYGEFGMNSSVYSSGTPADFFSLNNGVYFSGHDGDVSIGSGNGYKTFFAWGTTGNKAHVINASGAIGLNTNITGTTNFGTTGQVLLSQGSSASPIWAGASSIAGLGTMAFQNANAVSITGGTIDGTDIGQTTPAKVKGTNIEATGSFTGDGSGLTGTAPNLTAGNATAAQQLRTLGSNGTGVSIPAGKAVYLYKNGTSLQIKLADASTYDTSQVVGVTATVIPISGTGYVTMHGYISGLDTSAYQYGQILYLSGTTPGDLSATEPVSPLYAVHICYVMTVSATTGTIFVNPINHSVNDDYFIGLLKIAHGGTNSTATPTAGAIAYGDGTKYVFNSAGTSGQFLQSNGSSAPTWVTPSSVTVTRWSGGTTGILPSTLTSGDVTISGTLVIANGGTNGTVSPTAGAVAYGDGTKYNFTSAGTSGQVLTSNGASAPTWTTLAANVSSFSAGTTGFTPSTATTGAVTLAGTLGTANGGTNNTATPTAGTVAYGDGSKITYTAAGTTGQALLSNGSSAPTWGTPAGSLTITDDTSTNSTFYPTFTSATSGTITGEKVSSTGLTWNPSTNTLKTASTGTLDTGTINQRIPANSEIYLNFINANGHRVNAINAYSNQGPNANSGFLELYTSDGTTPTAYRFGMNGYGGFLMQNTTGTAGQVLISGGATASTTWSNISGGTF